LKERAEPSEGLAIVTGPRIATLFFQTQGYSIPLLKIGYPLPGEIYPYHPPGGFYRLGTYPIALEKHQASELQWSLAPGEGGFAGIGGEFRVRTIPLAEERVIFTAQVLFYLVFQDPPQRLVGGEPESRVLGKKSI
jgi:hypothetical protein